MFKLFKRPSPAEKKTEPSAAQSLPENGTPQPASQASETISARENQPGRPPSPGLLYRLFSTQTRTGRFMRPLLRWLAAITGLFALGLLAGYFLLFLPAQQELDNATRKLNEMNQSITQKDKIQVTAQMDRDQAIKALQQAQADLKKAASENDLLVVLSGVNGARVALVNKDGQSAKTLIEQAQTDLARAAGYIETQDKNRSDLLKTRLDLAAKELVSDPPAALADLDKLAADLNDLRAKLFKK